jgi:RNA polymerase sigma-70 factor (ECF subfamily)
VESDEVLVRRANRGDVKAFEQIYGRHRDWVYRLAWRFTGNQQDALDVVQETFLYLLTKFPGFELTASMTTFLYPAVKFTSLRVRRKRHLACSDEAALENLPDPEVPQATRDELGAAMAALSKDHREVVLMRFVDGMALDEIAEALNVPTGTVKSRLHNALRKLRKDPRTRRYFLE